MGISRRLVARAAVLAMAEPMAPPGCGLEALAEETAPVRHPLVPH